MSLCKYKDSLGKPKEGIHSYRFLGIAIADFLLTIVLALVVSGLICLVFKTRFLLTFGISLPSLFLLGIILHRLFCVKTTVDKLLFDDS